jgi:hypothetical protein
MAGKQLEIIAGSGISLTPNSSDNSLTIGATGGGDTNVIETVKVNGTPLTVTAKAVDVPVPTITASTTDLTAGSSALATGALYVVYE